MFPKREACPSCPSLFTLLGVIPPSFIHPYLQDIRQPGLTGGLSIISPHYYQPSNFTPALLSITDVGLAGDFAKISKEFIANGFNQLACQVSCQVSISGRLYIDAVTLQSKSIPDYNYAPWPYVIFPNDIVSCPIKAETNSHMQC